MAKGNMFLGMSRGSVGDVTFYRSRGNQVARARNRKPMNPKTEAQIIQRMILATASKAYSRMKGIVDHSFQGVQYGGVSQSYFLRRAMEDIRNWVAQTISITGEYPAALRNPLLYRGLAFPLDAHQSGVGLLISEGSIPSVPAVLETPEGGDPVFNYFGNIIASEDRPTTVENVLRSIGAAAGDQITLVGLKENGQFVASRFVVKPDADLTLDWDVDSEAFDETKTIYGDPVFFLKSVTGGMGLTVVSSSRLDGETYGYIASAVIISRKSGDVWQRSTQRLVWLNDAGDYTLTDVVAAEWMAGTAQINTVDPRYLNQAEQSL